MRAPYDTLQESVLVFYPENSLLVQAAYKILPEQPIASGSQ